MRNMIVVAGITLVVGSVLGFLVGSYLIQRSQEHILNANDSPITIADGSIQIAKSGKFQHGTEPTKNHWVKDAKKSVAAYISVEGCPPTPLPGVPLPSGCSADPSPSLIGKDNWILTLNDGTTLSQDPHDDNRINIVLSQAAMEQDTSGVGSLSLTSSHFEPATLYFGATSAATFKCPDTNPGPHCVLVFHYCANSKCD